MIAWYEPIKPAELAALLGVFDRAVEHRLARADQLCRGGQRAELEGACGVGLLRVARGGDVEQPAGRIDGLVLVARGAVADVAVAGEQDQPRDVGVDGTRHVRWHRDGGDQFAGRQPSRSARRRRAGSVPPQSIP